MSDPKSGDRMRLRRGSRWDSEHLRSHIGDVGVVVKFRPSSGLRATEVRLRFGCSEDCLEWVAVWRCSDADA